MSKKRFLKTLSIVLILTALAGCGSDDSDGGGLNRSDNEFSDNPTTAQAETFRQNSSLSIAQIRTGVNNFEFAQQINDREAIAQFEINGSNDGCDSIDDLWKGRCNNNSFSSPFIFASYNKSNTELYIGEFSPINNQFISAPVINRSGLSRQSNTELRRVIKLAADNTNARINRIFDTSFAGTGSFEYRGVAYEIYIDANSNRRLDSSEDTYVISFDFPLIYNPLMQTVNGVRKRKVDINNQVIIQ